MPRVIVSAGHTSKSPGTTINGVKEVDLNRKVAKAVISDLRRNGVLTLAVPYELELAKKINWINNTGYSADNDDIAIEFHSNESGGNKSGLEIWYAEKGQNKSQQLAEKIINQASQVSGLKNQGVFSEFDHELGSLAFVHNSYPISVLMECGYMDNQQDQSFFQNDKSIAKLAEGIVKGIMNFLNIQYKEKVNPTTKSVQSQQISKSKQPQVRPNLSEDKANKLKTMSTNNGSANRMTNPNNIRPTNNISSQFQKAPQGTRPTNTIGTAPAKPTGSTGSSYLAGREQRKEMIKKNYIKILGREPNQSDLNYFLNIGINEDQLIKKMVDSQEHVDIVKSRQEVLEVKAKFHAQQAELISLRSENTDNSELMKHFQRLINQKNQSLSQMQYRINQLEQYTNNVASQRQSTPNNGPKYNEPFIDRLFKYFSDRLG